MANHESEHVSDEIPTASSSLLNRLRDMDPEGWSRLVEVFGPIVYRWCRRAGVPEHESADVVQEVFTSVARSIGTFERQRPEGSFRAWMATIARNHIRDHYRRANRRPDARGGTDALQQWADLPDSALADGSSCGSRSISGQMSRRLVELLQAEFEPHTWQAFWMTAFECRPAAEVAHELEMSLASVYQAKSRVLRRLRQRLAEFPP